MANFALGNRTGKACASIATCAASALLLAGGTGAAEPNDDFLTATGPLTAGQTFEGGLKTTTDVDFHFFYLPDTTTVTLTTINVAKSKGGAADRGRTIASYLLRARKGKGPLPIADTPRSVKPSQQDSVTVSLLPGKYFIPVGRVQSTSPAQPNVPFELKLGPVGSTTTSFEIFESRCRAAQRRVDRIEHSIKRTQKRIAKAKKNDADTRKIVQLKLKLKSKREKADPAKKAERFACSIPR